MNWISHNLKDRLTNPACDFEININVENYRKLRFDQASTEVCERLYDINQKVFVGLSGGIDSEYVFRKFQSLGIPTTPIITHCQSYSEETKIAFDLCKEYQVEPVVLPLSEKESFIYFYEKVFKTINGLGIGSVASLVAAEYAKNNGGIFIKSDHVIGGDGLDTKVTIETNEWEYYCDLYFDNSYNFFIHTPEIVYSIVSAMNDDDCQTFKCDLFNIQYRDKIYPKYPEHVKYAYRELISKRPFSPNHSFTAEPKSFIEKYF